MSGYKSQYPTLRQAKTRWSSPSIMSKQGAGPSHIWYAKFRKDARDKLIASMAQARYGLVKTKLVGVREEADEQPIYHVTHTKHVAKIQKHGILPMKTSNWVKAKDGERYGGGEVYAFTHKDDAKRWAGLMDWGHYQKLGSGKISIITAHRPKDRKFEVDENDPMSQSGNKGPWIKTMGSIQPHHIIKVEPYHPRNMSESEDKIGKTTPSAEEIAKKHGVSVEAINAQIKKGIEVEKEHTNDEGMADEIARDHLGEFPDYYDRLGTMEKAAKKAQMKEAKKEPLKGFKMMRNDPPVPAPKKPHPVPVGFKRVKDGKFNVLKKVEEGYDAQREVDAYNKSFEDQKELEKNQKTLKDYFKKKYTNAGRRAQKTAERKAWVAGKIKEGYDQERELLKDRIQTHKGIADKFAKERGLKSPEAAFHRALVKRWEKELKEEEDLNEEVANSVGGGMSPTIGGEGNIHGFDPIMGKPVRRKRFAGKQVFTVDPNTYYKALLGKRKFEHYEKYLEGSPAFEEIRQYGRDNWDESIIIENEQTGAMVYLKYGSK